MLPQLIISREMGLELNGGRQGRESRARRARDSSIDDFMARLPQYDFQHE